MAKVINVVHIISNLSIGGAQLLLFDIFLNLKKNHNPEICVITIDSGEYVKKFTDAGIKVIDLKEKGLFNPVILFKLKKVLKEIKPDIVHTHLNKADFYGRIAAKYLNIPVIISTCHNYSTTHQSADIKKRSFFDFIDNLVIRYSKSYLIAISELVKQYLINRNAEFEKITEVIYNGVDVKKEKFLQNEKEQIELRKKLYISKDDFIISVIGRLEKQKGHLFFLDSIMNFLKDNSNIKVLIIGEGSLRNSIEEFINQNNLNGQVFLIGFVMNSQPFYEISNVVCVPSKWEGFGLIIIEAMIKSKIVLAANVGGIPEIIKDNKTGFLFNSEDKTELNEKLKYIYNNYEKLDPIRKNALEMVKEKFDIEKNTELYYQFYLKSLRQ